MEMQIITEGESNNYANFDNKVPDNEDEAMQSALEALQIIDQNNNPNTDTSGIVYTRYSDYSAVLTFLDEDHDIVVVIFND